MVDSFPSPPVQRAWLKLPGGFLYTNITNDNALDILGDDSVGLEYAMTLVYPQEVRQSRLTLSESHFIVFC